MLVHMFSCTTPGECWKRNTLEFKIASPQISEQQITKSYIKKWMKLNILES